MKNKSRRGRRRAATPDIGTIDSKIPVSAERQTYRLIRQAVMAGRFLPGSSMTSRSIAAAIGVSTSPVRDALKRLESDGAIESRNKSAFFVREPTREEYLEVVSVRLELEGHAASIAARNATSADINRIKKINREYARAKSLSESVSINFQFHFEIYRLAGSKILIDIIENLWLRIGPSMHLHASGYDIGRVVKNHQTLIDALSAGDARAAKRALRIDIESAIEVIAPLLPSNNASGHGEAGLL